MAKKVKGNKLGAWSFLIGVILAIVLGAFNLSGSTSEIILGLLVIIGILVGLFNITNSESSKFLLAALSIVIVAYMGPAALSILGNVAFVGGALSGILDALLVLFVPTTIIVALKSIFEIAKE